MKKLIYIINFSIMLFMQSPLLGQTSTNHSIDTDIHALRNNVIPDFRYHYDDYLQYAPAGIMVGLKACGYEGRSTWAGMLVSDAFSAAIMAAAVNGVKYSVGRLRPDGSRHNSFPSGHTATTFMTATMLHKEYGWRSPWFSIGGYTVAAVTGISRIMNNRHWLTDVVAGAAVGIGAVHLGYYLTDLIFKDKHIKEGYIDPEFFYDPSMKHYVAEMIFARRFILNEADAPFRGSMAGVSVDIPVIPGIGITTRATASSLICKDSGIASVYNALAGGYYNLHFAKRFELQAKALGGYAWQSDRSTASAFSPVSGLDVCAGLGLSFMLDSNFKIKAFAEYETMQRGGSSPWFHSLLVGFGTAWLW